MNRHSGGGAHLMKMSAPSVTGVHTFRLDLSKPRDGFRQPDILCKSYLRDALCGELAPVLSPLGEHPWPVGRSPCSN
jgi:hypothetical protein